MPEKDQERAADSEGSGAIAAAYPGDQWLPWWRHSFYRARWKRWYLSWNEQRRTKDTGSAALNKLADIGCNRDVLVRLAFLVASHKPADNSPLTKDPKKQQRLRRLLQRAQSRFSEGASILGEAATEIELRFIYKNDFEAASDLAQKCEWERRNLLDHFRQAPGHELYALVTYVRAFKKGPRYTWVTDLLHAAYEAYGRKPPTEEAIAKTVQRYGLLRDEEPSILNVRAELARMVEPQMEDEVKYGTLRKDLITDYPEYPVERSTSRQRKTRT